MRASKAAVDTSPFTTSGKSSGKTEKKVLLKEEGGNLCNSPQSLKVELVIIYPQ